MIQKLKANVRRLRLKEGDIILVRDRETRDQLMEIQDRKIPSCFIVIAPDGVHRLSKEYLRKLIEES